MFIWKEEFELGIYTIDSQHKRLFEIGNDINEMLIDRTDSDDDYDKICDVIDELKSYTEYHFATEEQLLKEHGYPDYENHKKEHMEFIEYLKTVDFGMVDENQTEFLRELLKEVVTWVFNHIMTTDYLYKDFFVEKGIQ